MSIDQVKATRSMIRCPHCQGFETYRAQDDNGRTFRQNCTRCDGWGILVSWTSPRFRRMDRTVFA